MEARNEYGWSQPSEPLIFRTRPEYKGISNHPLQNTTADLKNVLRSGSKPNFYKDPDPGKDDTYPDPGKIDSVPGKS